MDTQPNELQHDFRMKRHPELQPFVPYDKDRHLTSSKSPLNFGASVSSRTNHNNSNSNTIRSITSSDAKNPPKKCVSMNRLNQLAQPKRVPNNNINHSNGKRKIESVSVSNGKQQSPLHQAPRQVHNNQQHRQQSQQQPQQQQKLDQKINQSEQSLNGDQQVEKEVEQSQESVQQDKSEFLEPEEQQLPPEQPEKEVANLQDQQLLEPKHEQEPQQNNHDQNISNEASLFLSFTKEDEDKRITADEELKEIARREEEERQSRQILVDSILSKFNNSS